MCFNLRFGVFAFRVLEFFDYFFCFSLDLSLGYWDPARIQQFRIQNSEIEVNNLLHFELILSTQGQNELLK